MKITDLKPCPFCGGVAEFSIGKTGDGKDWHYIECGECGSTGPNVKYADHNIWVKEANAEAWNRRAALAVQTHVMKITDEMVARAEREYWDMTEDPEGARDMRAVLSNFAAALAVQTQQEVEVKPLEWAGLLSPREDGPAEPTGDIEAATLIGDYSVCLDEDEGVSETPWCAWSPVENIGHFESLEAAKAAAQSDYETRIRSAICGGDGDV